MNTEIKKREDLVKVLINRKTPRAYNIEKGYCVYDHNVNGGCAIGCVLDKDLAESLGGDSVLNDTVLVKLPDNIIRLGDLFLSDIQVIHDDENNWIEPNEALLKNDIVWSNEGIVRINNLIDNYGINLKKLKHHDD